MIHADLELARRLEAIICNEWRRLAQTARSLWPEKTATCLEVAGGVALWLGEGSLVNVAAGLAMEGPIGESELRQVEDFYTRRGAPPILATCPFADLTLFALLSQAGLADHRVRERAGVGVGRRRGGGGPHGRGAGRPARRETRLASRCGSVRARSATCGGASRRAGSPTRTSPGLPTRSSARSWPPGKTPSSFWGGPTGSRPAPGPW